MTSNLHLIYVEFHYNIIKLSKYIRNTIIITSGFATTHVLVQPELPDMVWVNLGSRAFTTYTIEPCCGSCQLRIELRFFRFFVFPANREPDPDFFSLKPSPSKGESSLKISGHQDSPFRRSQRTNKHTHRLTVSLTYKRFDREI